jgi:hypothetical protein
MLKYGAISSPSSDVAYLRNDAGQHQLDTHGAGANMAVLHVTHMASQGTAHRARFVATIFTKRPLCSWWTRI